MHILLAIAVVALTPDPIGIDTGGGGDPTPIVGGWEAAGCAWPSACEVSVSPAQCSGVLVHPQVVLIDDTCYNFSPDASSVWFQFGDGNFLGEGFSAEAPRDQCQFDGQVGFCVLSAPLPIPYAPIPVGCERALLKTGTELALVGFGAHEVGVTSMVKYYGVAEVADLGDGIFFVEGQGAPCAGDSGAPAFMRLSDGSWRTAGMALTTGCDNPSNYADLSQRVAWIESESGFDITPCHDADGLPDPTDACGAFYAGESDGAGTWDDLCTSVQIGGEGGVCSGDDTPPRVAIESPADATVFDPVPSEVQVEAIANDAAGLGVRDVRLRIGDDLLPDEDRDPPYAFTVVLPEGRWTVVAVARDWGGNEAESEPITLIVGDPPPDEGETTGSEDTGDDPQGTSDGSSGDDGTGEGQADEEGSVSGRGCGCNSAAPRTAGWLLLLALLAARRRSSSAAAVASAIALASLTACASAGGQADDRPSTEASGGSDGVDQVTGVGSTSTSGVGDATSSSSSGDASGSSTSGGATGESSGTTGSVPGGPAGPGWEACLGIDGDPCELGAMCLVNSYETVGACAVPCGADTDCPPVGGGNAEPYCLDTAGACVLDCSEGQVCPDDMVCALGVCLYYATAPGGGQCPDEQITGAPQSLSGNAVGMGDDLLPVCWYSSEDVAYEFTADQAGWYYFDAEQSLSAATISAYDGCGGDPLSCRTGFAQFIAELWLELDADQTIVIGVDAAEYQLDIEYVGDVPDGHCCFGSFEGCDDPQISDCVCGVSPGCCDAWDAQCATLAALSCSADCG